MKKTRNVVWIHPKDAEEYHQADFDGDQLMVSPASKLDEIKVLGIKYNHFANENFASKQWKKHSVTLEVGVFELPESHPEFYLTTVHRYYRLMAKI
ncbi:hypothetical protein [Nostoc sp. LPT]|uniref:hypothetical protein n=1 Tax=Nostoc sp. LPT TaxID=2815387 RepID=UPI0025D3784B|nr:hypothetical protein [Nostoc sp. LPT]